MSGVHGVEREDQSRGRMSLTLLTAHTDGAVQTPNPPIQNTHTLSSHIHTHRADVCWGRFEVFAAQHQHLDFFFLLQSNFCVV